MMWSRAARSSKSTIKHILRQKWLDFYEKSQAVCKSLPVKINYNRYTNNLPSVDNKKAIKNKYVHVYNEITPGLEDILAMC